jgi:hypothetical protein
MPGETLTRSLRETWAVVNLMGRPAADMGGSLYPRGFTPETRESHMSGRRCSCGSTSWPAKT